MKPKKKRPPNPRPLYAPSVHALELRALQARDPEEWRKMVAKALEKGNLREAAKELKVSLGVVQRAIRDEPDLVVGLEDKLGGPGNPNFGPGYDGPRRGPDKEPRKKRIRSRGIKHNAKK